MRELISPEQRALYPGAIKEVSSSLAEGILSGQVVITPQSTFLGHGLELTVRFIRTANGIHKGTSHDSGNWLLGLNNAARSGFYAGSQIMNLATPAYAEHCENTGKDMDSAEFSRALLGRESFQNVLLFLANMHVDKNSAVEYCLGMKQVNHSLLPGRGNYGENSFVIESNGSELSLNLNPYVIDIIKSEPDVSRRYPDEEGRRCPAIFAGSLERLWRLQVETAEKLGVTSTVLNGVKAEILQG